MTDDRTRPSETVPDARFPPGLLTAELSAERERAAWAAFAPILAEIGKLRELDLTELHPAVVFVPAVQARNREP